MPVFQVPAIIPAMKMAKGTVYLSSSAQTISLGFVPDVILFSGEKSGEVYAYIAGSSCISSGIKQSMSVYAYRFYFTGNGTSFDLLGNYYDGNIMLDKVDYVAIKF